MKRVQTVMLNGVEHFKLGSAVFTAKDLKALQAMRWDFRNGRRLKIPKTAMAVLQQATKLTVDDLWLPSTTIDELLEEIRERLDEVRQDPIFAQITEAKAALCLSWLLFLRTVGLGRDWDRAQIGKLSLAVLPMAEYRTDYCGETFRGIVDGLTRLTGAVSFPSQRKPGERYTITTFPKFVTHPFHQYGQRTY